ncbi:carbohydrate-binding module family 1 protein [Amniculicola lignicola CBS 123094]|uniref:AA9 family lytic polysaccharide monooxygenase n=1 Tax=Amniculicola lignicola CBS 123094 TaxID=1392246 RepID=A0A6A5VZ50_9PLEO|nr:carbohydrate-binding module family 1 protein [Amniculicola lignicola CBS 123094]
MKLLNALLATSFLGTSSAHAIFQKLSVNGVDQGQLKGIRAPDSDYPIQSVTDASFSCNKDIKHKDTTVISIPAGAKVGAWWGHVIGGAQGANDPDHPIAKSHKGPIIYYLAKVDNAATTSTTGLKWFKVAHEGLANGKWAVDSMIQAQGWHYFTMPNCIAPGDYLLRVELIALHGAQNAGGAQFYMECAQIRVTGSGTNKGGSTVSFPGAYSANDPGVKVSIYDNSGQPYMAGRQYVIPGPAPLQCGAGETGAVGEVEPSEDPISPVPEEPVGVLAPLYTQCGGKAWEGATTCAEGVCKANGEWYSQCVPA